MPDADRDDLAQGRTALAEDRTVLANERTYASWLRTGMAAIGVGLGFRALLRTFEPAWIAKSVASAFILAGIAMIWFAWHRACDVLNRLESHEVRTMSLSRMRWITWILMSGGVALGVVLWFI